MKEVTAAQVEIVPEQDAYTPGETVRVTYAVEGEVDEVELSLAFRTEGTGDEDEGVTWLERRRDRRGTVALKLPRSPCSYDGTLIKIIWQLRVRAYRGETALQPMGHPLTIGFVQQGRERDDPT